MIQDSLSLMRCIPCHGGLPTLTVEEIATLQPQVPDWQVIEVAGIKRLQRIFSFKDYASSITFVNRIAELAEQQDHHPRMTIDWGKVSVAWWTHAIRGLHHNDFIMAARTDLLYS